VNRYNFDPEPYKEQIFQILSEVRSVSAWDNKKLQRILPKFPRDGNGIFSRDQLVIGYRKLITENKLEFSQDLMDRIKMKPVRTISGLATVTVLTKPFPCPGKCIFCPNDVRMPKSYLADEPGAQRAERNNFDPYLQTYNRLLALRNTGHSTEKIELIVLGGTWSFYPESYQIWFIKRCFDALNDFGVSDARADVKSRNLFEEADRIPRQTKTGRNRTYNEIVHAVASGQSKEFLSASESAEWKQLFAAHTVNESALCRCVGLVIETRPDYINEKEIIKIRKLGATKVQIGIQSLNDKVLNMNKRGHGKAATANAIKLLRKAAFKIHAHWMPNLYGATVKSDTADYKKLWSKAYRPDELKIYPTSVIANTELYDIYKQGKYKPYSYDQLLEVLVGSMPITPRYCRITRVIRDIPSTDIVAGNKLTNFRQIAENKLKEEHKFCQCIRCREIKAKVVESGNITEDTLRYKTTVGREYFLSYRTMDDDKLIGFLRLTLPDEQENFIEELAGSALIREVHVYGQLVDIGAHNSGKAQHLGIGKKLLARAVEIAAKKGFRKISVISAIGTRKYYQKQGFELDDLYMTRVL
jgi:elongator complex protein 3